MMSYFTCNRGFTLVEVILALTIMSMVAALIFACLNIAGRSWQAGENRVEAQQRIRNVTEELTSLIRSGYNLYTTVNNRRVPYFFGGEDSLKFISTKPGLVSGSLDAGLYQITILLDKRRETKEQGLVLKQSLPPDLQVEDRPLVKIAELDPDVVFLKFQYLAKNYDDKGQEVEEWVNNWDPVPDENEDFFSPRLFLFPEAVKLSIGFYLESYKDTLFTPEQIIPMPVAGEPIQRLLPFSDIFGEE